MSRGIIAGSKQFNWNCQMVAAWLVSRVTWRESASLQHLVQHVPLETRLDEDLCGFYQIALRLFSRSALARDIDIRKATDDPAVFLFEYEPRVPMPMQAAVGAATQMSPAVSLGLGE